MPPYIIKRYRVLKTQYDYISGLTEWSSADDRKLFCHLLASTFVQYHQFTDGFIPVSASLMESKLPRADWRRLWREELIQARDYIALVRSRMFAVEPEIIRTFVSLSPLRQHTPEGVRQYKEAPKVNLFTGARLSGLEQSSVTDDNRNELPELIKQAIRAFDICYFNLPAVLEHLRCLEASYQEQEEGSEEYTAGWRRYLNDANCFRVIMDQLPTEADTPGIYQFQPAYKVQSTGRIGMDGGGLQSCSRAMKHAAYTGVPRLNNYDIKASQAHILRQFLAEAEIPCPHLEAYLNNPTAKHTYADDVGISVDTWKNCLYAIIMGGRLISNLDRSRRSGIKQYLLDEFNGNRQQAAAALSRFHRKVRPIYNEVKAWHEYLTAEYIPAHQVNFGGKWYLYNAVQRPLCLDELADIFEPYRRQARIAAFLLQGLESCFIHHLTLLGSRYDFKPIANEHDGLVVIGEIPQEAVQEAQAMAGLQHCEIVEKPFIDMPTESLTH